MDNTLKSAWVRQLRDDWHNANYSFFKKRMRLPCIDLIDSRSMLGKWEGGRRRRLSISVDLILRHPWEYTLEVLYHEMAHQYVEDVMGVLDGPPHGGAFQMVCDEHGIDPTASGDIADWVRSKGNGKESGSAAHRVMDRVHKLLALAASANRYEAESAMAKAHELLLKHNLSLLETNVHGNYLHKQIGEVGRKNAIKSLVTGILSEFFFVEAIWAFGYDPLKDKKGRILEIYGTRENVKMAEYVHHYLHNISALLWKTYKDEKKITGNKHRRTFIYGLLNGFHQKLDKSGADNRSKSLIWKGDPKLNQFYRRRNPRITRSAVQYSALCGDAYMSGMERGKSLVLHKGVGGGNGDANGICKARGLLTK